MKANLIKLAKEKGFNIALIYDGITKYSTKEDTRYYLWMCLIQKWLRNKYNIHINITLFYRRILNVYNYQAVIVDINNNKSEKTKVKPTYENALEYALIEGLKLIEI